ncbi:MAG: hypothetical protein J6T38_10860 [Bacteroidaceae bacterium]|nr:hypothetical protein [Bacteroidaceae bacterium]
MEKNSKHQDELLRTVMHRVAKDTDRTSLSDDFADRLVQRIRKEESAKRNQMQHKRIWLSVGIAAAILLLLVMGFWLNGKFNEKPELVAKTDTTKAAPLIEEKKVEEQHQKPVEHKEQADSVNKVKEMQRIARPPKRYMAKVEKEELSEPEIQKKTLESEVAIEYAGSTVWRADENMFQSTYEDVVREIQERGERMNKSIELAMGDDLY